MRIEVLAGFPVLVADGDGPTVTASDLAAVIPAAFEGGASTVAIAVGRIDPTFFDLRTGAAGEIVQKLVNYRLRLAVVGELPAAARKSAAFTAFVREGNRGDGPWFVPTLPALGDRLARA